MGAWIFLCHMFHWELWHFWVVFFTTVCSQKSPRPADLSLFFISVVQNPGKVFINSQKLQFLLCWENCLSLCSVASTSGYREVSIHRCTPWPKKPNWAVMKRGWNRQGDFCLWNQEMCFEAMQGGPGGDLCFSCWSVVEGWILLWDFFAWLKQKIFSQWPSLSKLNKTMN